MADQYVEKLDKVKKLLDRIKKIAENVIDEVPAQYKDDASYLYSVASSTIQKIELDEEDRLKELEEDEKLK
jgi:hypothetical protein